MAGFAETLSSIFSFTACNIDIILVADFHNYLVVFVVLSAPFYCIFLRNPLTPRVKLWLMQSFLTFDSMDRTLKCDHSLESC